MGGHSEWADILANYGLLGGPPLILTVFLKLKKTRLSIRDKIKKSYYSYMIILFIVYGFIEPFLRIYHVGFAIFLFVPGILMLNYQNDD